MEQENKQSYAEAIAELEKIVRTMQSDSCSIDNLNQLTARALELIKFCKGKLLATDEQLQKILSEIEK